MTATKDGKQNVRPVQQQPAAKLAGRKPARRSSGTGAKPVTEAPVKTQQTRPGVAGTGAEHELPDEGPIVRDGRVLSDPDEISAYKRDTAHQEDPEHRLREYRNGDLVLAPDTLTHAEVVGKRRVEGDYLPEAIESAGGFNSAPALTSSAGDHPARRDASYLPPPFPGANAQDAR